jgi:ferrous iron transport protein B
MELPPYHLPTLRGVSLRTWDRLRMFVSEAGRVIVIMVLALNLLNSLGTDGSFGNANSETSVLSSIGKAVTPVFAPLGIREDNWPATVGIFTGVLAKEVVVGTLDSLYTSMTAGPDGAAGGDEEFDLPRALGEAAASIPANLGEVADRIFDPLGMDLGDIGSAEASAAAQQVGSGVFGTMVAKFHGGVGAFAYLLFILLYFPCVATLGAIVRETGRAWAAFVAVWTTATAFTVSTLFYQIATYNEHPVSSSGWILGLLGFAFLAILALRLWGQRGPADRDMRPREARA